MFTSGFIEVHPGSISQGELIKVGKQDNYGLARRVQAPAWNPMKGSGWPEESLFLVKTSHQKSSKKDKDISVGFSLTEAEGTGLVQQLNSWKESGLKLWFLKDLDKV